MLISHFHHLKFFLSLKRGIALTRWSRGLSVMMEKMFGCTLISKLWAILLMEADFDFANKIIYGVRMLNNARFHGIMMEKSSMNAIGWQTMAYCQRHYSTT